MTTKTLGLGTILARAGRRVGAAESLPAEPPQPLAEPIALASVYRFADLEQVDAVWEKRQPGYIYRRFGHPNAATLEALVAALEGAEAAVACNSGMAAIVATLAAHVKAGETIVAQRGLYGGTETLLREQLARLGVATCMADEPTPEAFAWACASVPPDGGPVRAFLVESIANPSLKVADLPGLAALARSRGALLIVDNTFATPLGCRPLQFGSSVVVHSATKYLNGHSDVVGGLAAGPPEHIDPVRRTAAAMGLGMSPLDAWLTVRGLKTLHLRFARQQTNAAAIAKHLSGRAGVSKVLYPGLPEHPDYALATRVLSGFGAMVSFELTGGAPAVDRFIRALRLITFAPSLGESETTVMYPARTSHRDLAEQDKVAAGAGPGLVRLSVGTEDLDDLLADLDQALEAALDGDSGRGPR